jgi:hypothetical protein
MHRLFSHLRILYPMALLAIKDLWNSNKDEDVLHTVCWLSLPVSMFCL